MAVEANAAQDDVDDDEMAGSEPAWREHLRMALSVSTSIDAFKEYMAMQHPQPQQHQQHQRYQTPPLSVRSESPDKDSGGTTPLGTNLTPSSPLPCDTAKPVVGAKAKSPLRPSQNGRRGTSPPRSDSNSERSRSRDGDAHVRESTPPNQRRINEFFSKGRRGNVSEPPLPGGGQYGG